MRICDTCTRPVVAEGLPNGRSAERSGTHIVQHVWRAHFVLRPPEAELLRPTGRLQALSAQGEKPRGARRQHTELAQVTETTDHGTSAFRHDARRGERTDAGNAQQLRS